MKSVRFLILCLLLGCGSVGREPCSGETCLGDVGDVEQDDGIRLPPWQDGIVGLDAGLPGAEDAGSAPEDAGDPADAATDEVDAEVVPGDDAGLDGGAEPPVELFVGTWTCATSAPCPGQTPGTLPVAIDETLNVLLPASGGAGVLDVDGVLSVFLGAGTIYRFWFVGEALVGRIESTSGANPACFPDLACTREETP
jgi:hypothetical protein